MQGSLTYNGGVLYVGRYAKTAWISSYDMDGRPLQTRFSFRDPVVQRSAAGGLAMDADRRLWVADGPAGRVRAFTLFGLQVVDIGDPPDCPEDSLGSLGSPTGVATFGEDEELSVVIASGGRRRHALQIMQAHAGRVRSLRPLGDPRGKYRGLESVAVQGEWLYAIERSAGRMQVFRSGEFHYLIPIRKASGAPAEPTSVALLSDGRAVVTTAGASSAVLLIDRAGRLLRVLAEGGTQDGEVSHPGGVAVFEAPEDGESRIFVIDRDGQRVQVFTLLGRCYGSFPQLLGS